MGLIRNVRKGFMFLRREHGISPEDAALVTSVLSDAERMAFFAMDEGDQVHSIRVARICQEALRQNSSLRERVLLKGALLHDIGKTGAHLGLGFRTFWVVSSRLLPGGPDWIGRHSAGARPGSLRHKMWVQVHHAALGANLLETLGTEEEVRELVRGTSKHDHEGDSAETVVVHAADADRLLVEVTDASRRGH